MVCFDWYFPEAMRTLMLKGADVVLHSANLVLPYCPDAMVTRCLENRVFAVTANRVGTERGLTFIGSSQITASNGEILARLPREGVATAMASIVPQDARNKDVTQHNNILSDRAVSAYELD
jgi:predicted amidohydrolase